MPLYYVKTISCHQIDYIVSANSKEEAQKAVEGEDGDQYEFSQQHIGEDVARVKQVTEEEYLKLFREKNSYLSRWSDDLVLAKIYPA